MDNVGYSDISFRIILIGLALIGLSFNRLFVQMKSNVVGNDTANCMAVVIYIKLPQLDFYP